MTEERTAGIDVAYAQGVLNWDEVQKNEDVKFAWIKAGESFFYDAQFYRNYSEAQKREIRCGAYYFFHIRLDPIKQAHWFCDIVGRQRTQDLPMCIDFEEDFESPKSTLKEFSSKDRCKALLTCAQEIERCTGKKPLLYTGAFILGGDNTYASELAKYPLWLAQYTSSIRWLPSQWKEADLWQYSGNGGKRLKGIDVDIDRNWFLKGNLEAFDAWNKNLLTGKSPVYPFSTVLGVQRGLEQLGFSPGKLDNKWGTNTRNALRDFVRQQGLAVSPHASTFDELFIPSVKQALDNALDSARDLKEPMRKVVDIAEYAAWRFRNFFWTPASDRHLVCSEDGMSAGDVEDEAA